MITAKNVTKMYDGVAALNDVSFVIGAGEAVALWGHNGAGKTTAIQCLLGLISFDGTLTASGVDVKKNGKQARMMMGYVPQEVKFYDLSVIETLGFFARLKKVSADRIPEIVDEVKLSGFASKSVNALSGGMKQRLALAVALLADPPILVLDEPTANLDVAAQQEFIEMVQGLNRAGKTVVFSSHRLDEVVSLAESVLVLDGGKLVGQCTAHDLVNRLELRRWLQIQLDPVHRELAHGLLENAGYNYTPNGSGVYVSISGRKKLDVLQIFAESNIPVIDFDITESPFKKGDS